MSSTEIIFLAVIIFIVVIAVFFFLKRYLMAMPFKLLEVGPDGSRVTITDVKRGSILISQDNALGLSAVIIYPDSLVIKIDRLMNKTGMPGMDSGEYRYKFDELAEVSYSDAFVIAYLVVKFRNQEPEIMASMPWGSLKAVLQYLKNTNQVVLSGKAEKLIK